MQRAAALLLFTAVSCKDSAVEPHPITAAPEPTAKPFTAEKVQMDDKAMGTHIGFSAYTTPGADEAAVKRIFGLALDEIRRLENLMTNWKPESEVSKVNAEAGKGPVKVSPETFEVVQKSLEMGEQSEGTFDITFETLHGLWKFDQDLDPHPPAEADVKAKLALVDFHHVKIDKAASTVFIDRAGTKIGLGGIAKGYAVDKAAAILSSKGLASFIVQAGGDLFTRGTKPDGSAWSAGIRDPRGGPDQYFATLPVSDHAFSTAGDYERSYMAGGKRYHHIIDPRTGFPATASRSVTIYAPNAFIADAIDDAVFILGPEKGFKIVDAIDDCGAVVVDAKNNLWISSRLKGKLRVNGVPTNAP